MTNIQDANKKVWQMCKSPLPRRPFLTTTAKSSLFATLLSPTIERHLARTAGGKEPSTTDLPRPPRSGSSGDRERRRTRSCAGAESTEARQPTGPPISPVPGDPGLPAAERGGGAAQISGARHRCRRIYLIAGQVHHYPFLAGSLRAGTS